MIEEWRWIKGYEDRYMVSNLGRIKSFLKNCDGHILSLKNRTGDYLRVRLSDKTKNKQTKGVHVLVAGTFIQEIPNGWEVHHIDGDKQNNAASNLEIVSPQNHKYETRKMHPNIANGLVEYNKHIKPKAIQQYTADGVFLATYVNAKEAEIATGICSRNILQVASKTPYNAKGSTRKQAGGYIWKFQKEVDLREI